MRPVVLWRVRLHQVSKGFLNDCRGVATIGQCSVNRSADVSALRADALPFPPRALFVDVPMTLDRLDYAIPAHDGALTPGEAPPLPSLIPHHVFSTLDHPRQSDNRGGRIQPRRTIVADGRWNRGCGL